MWGRRQARGEHKGGWAQALQCDDKWALIREVEKPLRTAGAWHERHMDAAWQPIGPERPADRLDVATAATSQV